MAIAAKAAMATAIVSGSLACKPKSSARAMRAAASQDGSCNYPQAGQRCRFAHIIIGTSLRFALSAIRMPISFVCRATM